MLSNNSDISYQQGHLLNLYQIDAEIIQHNDSEWLPLTVGINAVTNTTEEKVNQSISFSRAEKKSSSTQPNALKRLLIGVVAVMGMGALATGGYYCYMAGSTSTGEHSERTHLPLPANYPDFMQSVPVTQVNDQQVTVDYTRILEISRSPYPYYEEIHKKVVIGNNIHQLVSETTTGMPSMMTAGNYYPLDSTFKRELTRFCLSNIHDVVIKSYKAKPLYKCELLSQVIDKIHYYRGIYSVLRGINAGKTLAIEEKDNEILIKRKLTTLYLAAETIISGKDTLHFYINAMKDDKHYTSEVLIKREENIMNYFSAHQPVGEC